MNLFKTPLQRAFAELERMLTKNIAHSLFDIEFHREATDGELMLYYGASVDREAMIADTRRKLEGDQRLLAFYQGHKDTFIYDYGTEDATADFSGATGRHPVETAGSPGYLASADQGSGEGPDQGGERGDGHGDDAPPASADRGDGAEEHRSGGELDDTAGSDRRDAGGGEGTEDASGSGETITLTLPTESEARRLELIRIEDTVGVLLKQDGDDVTVLPYKKA